MTAHHILGLWSLSIRIRFCSVLTFSVSGCMFFDCIHISHASKIAIESFKRSLHWFVVK